MFVHVNCQKIVIKRSEHTLCSLFELLDHSSVLKTEREWSGFVYIRFNIIVDSN
jgi:hypothetical protein